ncbi:zinc finger MYM-type protein 3-like isoform X2 [Gigantopelta aegis]|uniref:zinc finger MYM-type protein 3-like isoform X2 n=1 Tax=Gigantopelta aegis TaxID=1735272 RepID=UPI001B88A5E3|nr:zinc finger MYM-type protein 3-like isoform X2 [Gigantopelta aegis]
MDDLSGVSLQEVETGKSAVSQLDSGFDEYTPDNVQSESSSHCDIDEAGGVDDQSESSYQPDVEQTEEASKSGMTSDIQSDSTSHHSTEIAEATDDTGDHHLEKTESKNCDEEQTENISQLDIVTDLNSTDQHGLEPASAGNTEFKDDNVGDVEPKDKDQQEPGTDADSDADEESTNKTTENAVDGAQESQEADGEETDQIQQSEDLDVNESDSIAAEDKTDSGDQLAEMPEDKTEPGDKDKESMQTEDNDGDNAEKTADVSNDSSTEKLEGEKEAATNSDEDMETEEARAETDSSEMNKQDEKSAETDSRDKDQQSSEVAMDTEDNKTSDDGERSAEMELDKGDSVKESVGADATEGNKDVIAEGTTESSGAGDKQMDRAVSKETADNKSEDSAGKESEDTCVKESKDSDVKLAEKSKASKGEDDDLVLIEDDKPEAIVVDDDDDDGDSKKDKLANGVINSGNDMGLQISSVSGRVDMPDDAADKSKETSDVKDEPKSPAITTDKKASALADKKTSGTSQKASKSQTCIVCSKVGRCKYNIVRNGDTKHLCDDICFRRFRSNPTQFLKGSTTTTPTTTTTTPAAGIKSPTTRSRTGSLPASSPRNYREEPDLPLIELAGSTSQTPTAAPAPVAAAVAAPLMPPPPPMVVNNSTSQYKTCTVCQLMNINTQKPFASWQGLDFCGEMCLNKFQSTLNTSCSYCASFIPNATRVLYSIKVGQEIRLFCANKCLQEFKKRLRLCAYCQTDLAGCPDSFSAPIGPQTFREFCSQTCLKKFEDKSNDVEIIGFESSKPKTAAKCSVCHKISTVKHNIKLNGVLNRLCSDPCLSAFQYANKLAMNTCDNCGGLCPTEETVSHFIQFEGQQKRFCKDTCVNTFRTINRKIVPCAWCGTKKPNFDMIERVDSNNKYQLFCSLNCLSLYRVNLQAKSNQSVNCDYCHKFVPAQYHLTMSDASVRNFCSYNCVMVFQSQFSANKTASQPTIHSQPTKIQLQQKPTRNSENAGINTRRRGTQNTQSSFPIISNVVSLAPQSSQKGQTVNIKSSGSVPVIVSGQSQTIRMGPKTVTAGTGTQPATTTQQIIIQPPPPKQMKNKSLLCKPFVQTKATSCRPHVQTKEVQTESDCGKPVLIPIPVPIYIPTPLAMYAAPTPQFIPIPIPIPIPIFIPTTKKSAAKILKQIKKIREKIPADPLEAELLQMAQAVAGGGEDSDSDTDHSDVEEKQETLDEESKVEEESNDIAMLESQIDRPGGEEDLVQMALRMAEEITGPVLDLESNVQLVAVSNEPPPVVHVRAPTVRDEDEDDWIPTRESRSRRGKRTSTGRGRGRQSKRQRVEAYREPTPEPSPPPVQQPPADANMHLKFTYGVNAWKHWVIHKNTLLEKVSKRGSGRLKLFKTDLLQCTADELNYSLCLFVKEVRKPNGEEYSPDSIYYLCLGIQQYLYENSRIDNIFTDVYYEKFTECLTEMLAKHEPKVNTAGQMLCRIEEEHLWECKQLGAHSPYVLLNTLIYFNTKHFMLKTIEDHMKLSFAHILKHWKKGVPPATTRTPVNQVGRSVSLRYYYGQSSNKKPKEGIPVYETSENLENPLRCPVKLYEFYLSKAPESIKNRNDLFYLLPERSCVPDSPVWYSTQSIPVETMSKMLGRILLVREIQEAHLHAQPVYV